MKRYKKALIALILSLCFTGCAKDSKEESVDNVKEENQQDVNSLQQQPNDDPSKEEEQTKSFQGVWSTTLSSGDDLSFVYTPDDVLYVSSKARGYQGFGAYDLSVKEDKVSFNISRKAADEYYELSFQDEKTLTGTMMYQDQVENVTLERTNSYVIIPTMEALDWENNLEENTAALKDNSVFTPEQPADITYTYALDEKENYRAFLDEYGLDEIVGDKTGDDLIFTLYTWFCEHFNHAGETANIPQKRDLDTLNAFCKENGGTNCRGLSIMLSKIFLAYNIPAKYMECLPQYDYFYDCHVVVHVYSEETNQWIMLDPTHDLYLTYNSEEYIDLNEFRQTLIDGTEINAHFVASESEHDGMMDWYPNYMAKNMFRFGCMEVQHDTAVEMDNNCHIYLESTTYENEWQDEEHSIVITADADQFFQLPTQLGTKTN